MGFIASNMFAINSFIQFSGYSVKMVTEKSNQNITIFCQKVDHYWLKKHQTSF